MTKPKEKEYDGSTPIQGKFAVLQESFIDNIIANIIQYKAYQLAGYKSQTDESAMASASALLRIPKIQARLAYKRAQLAKKTDISAERVIKEFARIALSDLSELYDEDGNIKDIQDIPEDLRRAIAGVEHVAEFDKGGKITGFTKKIKLWDKTKALENLGKHLGLFEKDNAQKRSLTVVEILAIVESNKAKRLKTGDMPLIEGEQDG